MPIILIGMVFFMLRRVALCLMVLCVSIRFSYALQGAEFPNSFSIKEQNCHGDGCFNLLSHGQKMGSLRPQPDKLATFDFFDELNQRQISASQEQAIADTLNGRYHDTYDDTNISEEEKIKRYVDLGCDLVQSHSLTPEQENAMLQFLKKRLVM